MKQRGLREYGTLAERFVREFDTKWLRNPAPPDEPLVSTADIQSLADLGNSYDMVKGMRLARAAPNLFGTLLAAGVALMVTLQAFFNAAMSIGLIPTKGVPMPFFSFGGSSLVVTLFGATAPLIASFAWLIAISFIATAMLLFEVAECAEVEDV